MAGYSQLTQLYPTGLEAPLQKCLPRTGLAGLQCLVLRSCRGVTDETLASLPDLAPGLGRLDIAGEQRQHAQAIDIRTQGGNDEHTHTVTLGMWLWTPHRSYGGNLLTYC